MKSIVAYNQPDGPRRSNITYCTLITKHDEKNDYLFYIPDKPEPGAAYVNLDGYLICPMEMFTPRQLKAAAKKYDARRPRS